MPYVQIYVPAPTKKTLVVHVELPTGFVESEGFIFSQYREARDSEYNYMYYCHHRECGGWIEGYPNEFRENTLDTFSLAGREGIAYHCRRCGNKIGFSGMIS